MARVIKREELKRLIDEGEGFALVNVLERDAYEKEHICGSINMPASEIEAEAPNTLRKDDLVVVYCGGPSCRASGDAVERLESMGYFNVRRYKGGIEEWKKSGYCMEGVSMHESAAA